MFLAFAGCRAGAPPPPPGSPVSPPAGERLTLSSGEVRLSMVLPPGFTLETETAPAFMVFNVWPSEPPGLKRETALGIYIGRLTVAYCPPDAPTRPSAFADWQVPWRVCDTQLPGQRAREVHLRGEFPVPVHIFVIGSDPGLLDTLQAIAETLRRP